MTSTTTNRAYPFPDETDGPDGATQIENLASAVDTDVQSIADEVDAIDLSRAALLSTLLGGAGVQYIGNTINPASISSGGGFVFLRDASNNILGGRVFVAPPSGIVTVHFGLSMNAGAGGHTMEFGIEVLEGGVVGSGTVFKAIGDDTTISSTAAATVPGSRVVTITGLTAGDTYNTLPLWRSTTAGTTIAGAHLFLYVHPEFK